MTVLFSRININICFFNFIFKFISLDGTMSVYLDTFRTSPKNQDIYEITSVQSLIDLFSSQDLGLLASTLVIGGGSNLLFVEPYEGLIILNRIQGIDIEDCNDAWHLHVGAGENWHDFVTYTINQKMYGLENLALIPGTVGASPIQNIGAYGCELKDFCEYVDVFNIKTLKTERILAKACQFGYRDSIFKSTHKSDYIITAVGIRLLKNWQPILAYGELSKLDPTHLTAEEIYKHICYIRSTKLPDPKKIGNAGSFFKNPIISLSLYEKLILEFPEIPSYDVPGNSTMKKLAAGWLIDKCGLKGFELGNAAVHKNQALVLINLNNASGLEIALLARHIQNIVHQQFEVLLEPEVRFIGRHGEIDSLTFLNGLEVE